MRGRTTWPKRLRDTKIPSLTMNSPSFEESKYWKTTTLRNLECNISNLCKFLPHKIIHTIFHILSLPLWPNFLITQFLRNHGSFRSYFNKINKMPSPNCNCPEKTIQMAHHLIKECSLWSKDRPPVSKSLPPPPVLQYHINTVSITSFLRLSSKHLKSVP